MKFKNIVSSVVVSAAAFSGSALADGSTLVKTITDAVDIAALTTFAAGAGALIIGLTMGEKAIGVAKRWVKKA